MGDVSLDQAVWVQALVRVIALCYRAIFATPSPGPSPRRFSKWRLVGRRPWQRLGHVVQNLQKILEIFIT